MKSGMLLRHAVRAMTSQKTTIPMANPQVLRQLFVARQQCNAMGVVNARHFFSNKKKEEAEAAAAAADETKEKQEEDASAETVKEDVKKETADAAEEPAADKADEKKD